MSDWSSDVCSSDLPLSVDVLADVAHMSRRTFTRRFREATGTTVTQWLNAQRVARAQQLLATTDTPIEAVAGAAGFGTPLGLRQQFGAQLGTTPSPERRTYREVSRPTPAAPPAHTHQQKQ